MKPEICLIGKGNALVYALMHCLRSFGDHKISVVPSKSDLEKDNWQFSVKQYCRENNILVRNLKDIYEIENLVVISIQFDIILNPSLFRTNKIYNIHFSLLPKYKGVYPAIWPILNNEKESGVTLHKIDAGIDTGDVIDQQSFSISVDDTSRDLYFKCLDAAFLIFKRNIIFLLDGSFKSVVQPSIDSIYYSKNSINFTDYKYNLNQTAYQIHNQVRAMNFREFQMPVLLDRKIFKTTILSSKSNAKPGTIQEQNEEYTIISTVDYDLKLYHDYYDDFHEACANGNINLIDKLLPFIKDFEVASKNGWTAMMIAAFNERFEVVKKLYDSGANINACNCKGTTVLMYSKSAATNSNRLEIMDYLISKGADVNAVDFKGGSLLSYAIKEGNQLIVDCLLQKGAKK